VIDEFDRFTLGPEEINVLRADLDLPATGWFPLGLPVRWSTDIERDRDRQRTWRRLHEAGLARRGRLEADGEQALRVATRPETGLSAFAALDLDGSILRARAVAGHGVALILRQDTENGPVEFEYRALPTVFGELVDLIGLAEPHPDPEVPVPTGSADDELSMFERADGRDAARRERARAIGREPRIRAGAFTGFTERRLTPELTWFDTARGRRMVCERADAGRRTLVCAPADNRVIYRRLISELDALRDR
jgi:ESX secretion-associated protein EspG